MQTVHISYLGNDGKQRSTYIMGHHAEQLSKSPKLISWLANMDPEFTFNLVEELKSIVLPNNRGILFSLLQCDVIHKGSGRKIPGVVFLQGESIGVLVILKEIETGHLWTLLVNQTRFPIGKEKFLEIPAGRVENSTKSIEKLAISELLEETTLDATHAKKVEMLGGFYPSPGGSSEFILLVVMEFEMSLDEIFSLSGIIAGNESEGEQILLKVIPLWQMMEKAGNDGKSIVAYHKYLQNCLKSGELTSDEVVAYMSNLDPNIPSMTVMNLR